MRLLLLTLSVLATTALTVVASQDVANDIFQAHQIVQNDNREAYNAVLESNVKRIDGKGIE